MKTYKISINEEVGGFCIVKSTKSKAQIEKMVRKILDEEGIDGLNKYHLDVAYRDVEVLEVEEVK